MSQASVRRKPNDQPAFLDTELEHLPPELRWREWMGRVEAVILAANEPVPREVLARVVGKSCNVDLVIDDIRAELASRPYARALSDAAPPRAAPGGFAAFAHTGLVSARKLGVPHSAVDLVASSSTLASLSSSISFMSKQRRRRLRWSRPLRERWNRIGAFFIDGSNARDARLE